MSQVLSTALSISIDQGCKFHVGINGVSVGEHPLVSQAVKTVFRLRPPLPQYQSTFDIVPVLAYVQSLHTASISLQLLSFKTLFLNVYSSIFRVSSMGRLAPSLQETRKAIRWRGRKGHHRK